MTKTKRKSRRKPKSKRLGPIWEVPDALWERILPILLAFWPKKPTGRHTANWRTALTGIIFRMRTGCQWEQLPRKFGPKSTVHDWFQRWCAGGVMERIWAELVAECDELGAVEWQWQSADAALGKARFGGEKGRPKSHGSWEKRDQEVGGGRWSGQAVGGGDLRGQRVGEADPARDDRGHRGRAPRTDRRGAAEPLPGWGLREPHGPGSGDRGELHPSTSIKPARR